MLSTADSKTPLDVPRKAPNDESFKTEFEAAGPFSKWSFHFVSSLIQRGQSKSLEAQDLFHTGYHDSALALDTKLEHHFQCCNSVWKALYLTFKREFWLTFALTIAESITKISLPVVLWFDFNLPPDDFLPLMCVDPIAFEARIGESFVVGQSELHLPPLPFVAFSLRPSATKGVQEGAGKVFAFLFAR